jgi:hypothetical protein
MQGVESSTINRSTEHNIATSFAEKMFRNYNPQERSSHLLRGESLKSRV